MDAKGILKALALELRHELEGRYDDQVKLQPGDLERRLAAIGVRRDRASVPLDELPHLPAEDCEARRVVDAFIESHAEAGQNREEAVAEFVREAAYTWANRLLALRCMEARGLIDEIVLQKEAYGGRSLQHHRLARREPERCAGEDEGLFAALFDEFERRAAELPLLFNPKAPEVALLPSTAALKRCIALLSGTEAVKGQERATDAVFTAPDALGWAYQYWNTEEKDRVFEKVRTKKGAKIEGAEIIPATCMYTEPYMVKFLVQNSLGAIWMGMHPESRLFERWEYYVRDAHRAPVKRKPVGEITFLDPSCGSGHFLVEAFDLLYAMYLEEGRVTGSVEVCASILENNLYGTDIDERAIQIAAFALYMKAKDKAADFGPRRVNLVAANIRLAAGKDHLEEFLHKHPDDVPLKPALLAIFEGLAHADELGSLLQIEQPVEKELRYLREREPLLAPATEWAQWERGVLERLRQHFAGEIDTPDLGAAFFGEEAGKGLSLVDLFTRRYDVVTTNPPYMGSKNMGEVVKHHVERYFAAGKRDLYAAFILRCLQLAGDGGRVAMVTQQSWMFLRSFADLRALDDEKRKKMPKAFGGVLRETRIETLAHLGPRAFSEIGGEVVSTVLFVLARVAPQPGDRLTAFRLVGPKSPEEKDALLRQALAASAHPARSHPVQARFLAVPQSPLCYWLRERFFELLGGRTLNDCAKIVQQVITANNQRFLRFCWELSELPTRWLPYLKAGGYGRWFGFGHNVLDWRDEGLPLKLMIVEKYPYLKGNWGWLLKEETFLRGGWTYTLMAQGCLGVRILDPGNVCDSVSPTLVLSQPYPGLGAILNCRLASYLLRATGAGLKFRESYVLSCPLPQGGSRVILALESACIQLKRRLVGLDLTERSFATLRTPDASSLAGAHECLALEIKAIAAVLHALEGLAEREVFAAYGIAGQDLAAVLDETGTPAGWHPLIAGYESQPLLPEGMQVPSELLEPLRREPRRMLSPSELAALKARLRSLYEAGPGRAEPPQPDDMSGEDEEAEDEAVSGARIPIPAETFLEGLSQKLEIHPISVYWLLRELREEGAVCLPELRRFVEDNFTVSILRLLGHRWPKQVEAGEPVPEWADRDGIIPITEGTGEPTLLERVRQRIAEDFGGDRVGATEREFEEIMGERLAEWLAGSFFTRHISQFRKRPIAWQIQSRPEGNGKRGKRSSRRRAPVFSCLIYYHRLDADLLPKLRTQYIGLLRSRLQTELSGLERLTSRTADQDARRYELEESLDELKAFDEQLEKVIVGGFESNALDEPAPREPLDQWTSRDGSAPAPASLDAFLAQERKYDPDLNDGVRVNIAPLQRAGLLAAEVLAAKDLDKAIADRAEWRADERRWCREGKLPRPGWWPAL
jgi:hypothetical protein